MRALLLAAFAVAALAGATGAGAEPATVDSAAAEPGLAARRARHARPLRQHLAMVPAYLLRAPFQVVNYPVEHYLVHKEPGAITVYSRRVLTRLGTQGVHLRVRGLGSGSGVGGETVYELPRRLTPGVAARLSVAGTNRGYDRYQAALDSIPLGAARAGVLLQYAERPQEDFFGLGAHSARSARSAYQQDEWLAQATGRVPIARGWNVALDAGVSRHDIGRGRDAEFPTLLEVFPATLSGSSGRFEFFDWGAGIVLDTRDVPTYARRGSVLSLRVQGSEGLRDTPHAFTKVVLEVQQFVRLPGNRRGLAARLRGVVTDNRGDGVEMPVFRLERVGGSRSLRGYQTFRFTDHDALVGNLEYRFPVWTLGVRSGLALDGAAFFDFGTALRQISDLQQRDLHSSGGLGLRMVSNEGLILRLDSAWSPEDYRFHAGLRGTF